MNQSRTIHSTSQRPDYPTPPSSFINYRNTSDYGPPIGFASPESDYHTYSHEHASTESLSPSPALADIVGNILSAHDVPPWTPPSQGEGDDDVLAISTAFHPGNQPSPDTIISSSDNVLFYVHSPTLVAACPDVFRRYLTLPLSSHHYRSAVIHLDAPASELNVILHALHGMSPAANSPDIDTLIASIDRMPTYNISPQRFVGRSSPIHDLLLSYVPFHPMEVYALGAHHNIHTLATTASSHLLSYNLATMTDQLAIRIGASYLNKLMALHINRAQSLRSIVLQPPHPHPPTKKCGFDNQRKITRAWALASAHIAWDANPDLSTYTMKNTLNPLLENIKCEMCHEGLQNRIKEVVVQWASVKVGVIIESLLSFNHFLTAW